MPRIRWLGFIKGDLASYQQGALPQGAVKLDMPRSTGELMKKAAVFLPVPFTAIFAAMFGKTYLNGQAVVSPVWVIVGVCAGFPALLLHELLHAFPYPKDATVHIGIYPKALAAVALVSYPVVRRRFIVMSLLPVVLGLAPMALFLLLPPEWRPLNGFLFGFAAMGLVAPYPDFYQVFQVLRQTPRGCRIQFVEDDIYWF